MSQPFPRSGACAGTSVSIKDYGFLEPEDDPQDLFCHSYCPILVVTGQPPAEFICL